MKGAEHVGGVVGQGTLLADPFPSDDGGFTAATVTPGLPGFIAMFILAVVVVLLVLDMTRRTRRVTARAAARERVEAEEADKADAADRAAKAEVETDGVDPDDDDRAGAPADGTASGDRPPASASASADGPSASGDGAVQDPAEGRSSLEDPEGAEDVAPHDETSREHGTSLEDGPEGDDRR